MIAIPAAVAWLATALVLLAVEVLAPGAFMMWIGLAALGTGAFVLLATPGFEAQVACFAVLTAAAIALGLHLRRAPARRVNAPDSGLVGRTAHALWFDGPEGRVRLGDSDWPAQVAPGAAVPAVGTRLLVVATRGLVLVVEEEKEGQGSALDPAGATRPLHPTT